MAVIWDTEKERKLKAERGIALAEIADLIVSANYLDILENPSRPRQAVFIVDYHRYTHVVPFVLDRHDNIILKTAFPSRKFHKIYGKRHENKT
jgi:uncharacterized DUF497 family protein